MPISVRLDKKTQARLERLARTTGRTKSELIREAIDRLDEAVESEEGHSTYDRLSSYIGTADLGAGNRAERAEEILREGFGRKKRA